MLYPVNACTEERKSNMYDVIMHITKVILNMLVSELKLRTNPAVGFGHA